MLYMSLCMRWLMSVAIRWEIIIHEIEERHMNNQINELHNPCIVVTQDDKHIGWVENKI
jgi:hypothetical protein